MYYQLISEICEKPDLVDETHCVDEPQVCQSRNGMKNNCAKQNSLQTLCRKLKKIVQANLTTKLIRMRNQKKISQQICGGNRSIVAEEGSRGAVRTQLDERSEPNIFEIHALNRNHILQSVEKLILHNRKLIPAICNTDNAMSIAGGGI